MSIEAALKLEQYADQLEMGIDWGHEPDRSVIYITTTGTSSPSPYEHEYTAGGVMPEQLYTYRRIRDAQGQEHYERVPYDPSEPTLEPAVTVPRLAPAVRNGEQPGQGSRVVDELLRRTSEAAARRYNAELEERLPKEPAKPSSTINKPSRLIEP